MSGESTIIIDDLELFVKVDEEQESVTLINKKENWQLELSFRAIKAIQMIELPGGE